MSTFSKLSLVAQYDDMCRLVNKLIQDSAEEEEASISYLENIQKRWKERENAHKKEKQDLKSEISTLHKEIKKLNRQLTESRTALAREAEEKKGVARERKALLDQIRQVRQLVEREDCLGNSDAHRKRVIKCLDVDRLSPIHSFDDSSDGASGLDYDRTEEDIMDPEPRRRSTRTYHDAEENLPSSNEQPTLLYRYIDKGSDSDQQQEELRRSSRRSGATQHLASHRSHHETNAAPNIGGRNFAELGLDTDSNGMETDDNDIENVRQQLKKYEAEKRAKMAAPHSALSIRNNTKSATLSGRSATNLVKSVSNVSSKSPAIMKQHSFISKKQFTPDVCGPCGGKIKFFKVVLKCENCGVVSHPECKDLCPLPCVKIRVPNVRSNLKKTIVSDYVNSDAVPQVPALIVHCCNEIERVDNIKTVGLYNVKVYTRDIEELEQKILKSKSGMPNLSREDVHLLAGVVKHFLEGLHESLITTTLWSLLAEVVSKSDNITKRTSLETYIGYDLPAANRDTLAFLMQHLHAIAKHSNSNMMTKEKLAKALARTIVGYSCREPPQSSVKHEHEVQVKIMDALFDLEEDFWSGYVERSPRTTNSLGSRLLDTPSSSSGVKTRGSSRAAGTLPTPKVKPLFS